MAQKSGRKKLKRDAKASGGPLDIATVEGALEAALEREAKLASRLEATRTEVATLRVVLTGMLPSGDLAPGLPEDPRPAAPVATTTPRSKARARRAAPAADEIGS
jgi:hypothetical protein